MDDFGSLTYAEFFALTQAIVELTDVSRRLVDHDTAWVAENNVGPYYADLAHKLARLQKRLAGKTGVPGWFLTEGL